MKIIIAGSGDVGFHLAKLLSHENQEITLIDQDTDVLEYAGSRLDVLTIKGDGSSLSVLQEANVSRAKLFIAATTSEKTNLIAAILAKKMGAKQTIARIENPEYLDPEQREHFRELGVDHLISPRYLAAMEIRRLLDKTSFTDIFEFDNGKVNVIGTTIDEDSDLVNMSIEEIDEAYPEVSFRPLAILRGAKTLIPDARTILHRNDHVYLMARDFELESTSRLCEKETHTISKVMIIGESPIALKTAKLIEKNYSVTVVCHDREMCKKYVELLDDVLVIEGDPSNVEILKEEGIEHMDAFIALTHNTETNILASLMAEQCGVYKTIALVDNMDYTHISQNIGIDTLINEKIIAANNIFRFIRKGKIEAIATLHGVDAELIEFNIHRENQLTKKVLGRLPIPEGSRVAGVIRNNESIVPHEDLQLQVGDKVIVFATAQSINSVENLFN